MNMLDLIKATKTEVEKIKVEPGKVTSTGKSQALGGGSINVTIDDRSCILKLEVFRILSAKESAEIAIQYGQTVRRSAAPAAKVVGAFTEKSSKGRSLTREEIKAIEKVKAKKDAARAIEADDDLDVDADNDL